LSPRQKLIPITEKLNGYWEVTLEVPPATHYVYVLDDELERPDPASFLQPQGVHDPSEVVNLHDYVWNDHRWKGLPLEDLIMYELHVGTFTPEGSFSAICPRLKELYELGINAIELLPVAQFSGERNWGYDGVYPYAPHHAYGGVEELKTLVDTCHSMGISVILDVVYNHLGPEGNYFEDFGPFFTDRYKIPWGKAINLDGAYSDQVRDFFIENALYWLGEYHIDGLRLDAVHAIYDGMSAKPFIQQLAETVQAFSDKKKRDYILISENNKNDVKDILSVKDGGYGFDACWCDDFHHSLHGLLTGEQNGYYVDFGTIEHIVKALREGHVYSWQYSRYRKKHHGSSSARIPGRKFIVYSQNHDQVGNRMMGERLSTLISFEAQKLAAGVILLSPYVPLLFMGEEYGETNPFLYFISHDDPELIEAVRKGRKQEFKDFHYEHDPPDPAKKDTFVQSKLRWEKRNLDGHKVLLDFYRALIKLRKNNPALFCLEKKNLRIVHLKPEKAILIERWAPRNHLFYAMNFEGEDIVFRLEFPKGRIYKIFDSSDQTWNGPGERAPLEAASGDEIETNGYSFVVYEKGE
jgi:maltooligosyltrehalose trehalohydrolase